MSQHTYAALAWTFCAGFLASRDDTFCFWAFNFAHRARCAAAILFRAEADILRFPRCCLLSFNFAHLARWAAAILAREAADLRRPCVLRPAGLPT